MLLTNTFTVPVSADKAWEALLDLPRVAPCLPGASVDSFDGTVCRGRVKVKLGPISLQYRGVMTIESQDADNRRLQMAGTGKEVKGAGSATATIVATLTEEPGSTRVTVETNLGLTGKPAQFGSGILTEVSDRLIATFARNLEQLLAADAASPEQIELGQTNPEEAAPLGPPQTPHLSRNAEPQALNLLSLVPIDVRRYITAAGLCGVGFVCGVLVARRRSRRR